ncbi:hypothetical protein GMO_09000 [Gluconobacter morbifer G707]|uniref:Uncharacterized protein n=1 Tax=Gluconobacter morbifer G707 TaxID=1088869 RepID=G6XHD4_9PROT|nr:hypothetical protein GMO_09000 [Gluconobacter morbifer G707]
MSGSQGHREALVAHLAAEGELFSPEDTIFPEFLLRGARP